MILPKLVYVPGPRVRVRQTPFVDGYGLPFDPQRHLYFVLGGVVPDFTPSDPPAHLFLYDSPKDRPAGHWDKAEDKGNR